MIRGGFIFNSMPPELKAEIDGDFLTAIAEQPNEILKCAIVSKIDDPFSTTIGNLVDALEGILIEGLEPRQNRRQGDNWGFEYYQKVDDAIAKNDLINKLQKLI